jgi:hypothetical protein
MKSSVIKGNKLFNIRVIEGVSSVYGQQFNGPYIGVTLVQPDLQNMTKMILHAKMHFDAAEPYQQIYKIVLADEFYNFERTTEVELVGPWLAVGNVIDLTIDLTDYLISGINNSVALYAGDDGGTTDGSSTGSYGTRWTFDADTYLDNFFMEVWYEAIEKP